MAWYTYVKFLITISNYIHTWGVGVYTITQYQESKILLHDNTRVQI